jgi:hypothetical protein
MVIQLYGLIAVIVLLTPSFASLRGGQRGGYAYPKTHLSVFSRVGSFGSIFFMIFGINGTYLGPWFPFAAELYLLLSALLLLSYVITWFVTAERDTLCRAVLLSALPSLLYLSSGILLLSLPLIVTSIVYAAGYIPLCIRNYYFRASQNAQRRREQ